MRATSNLVVRLQLHSTMLDVMYMYGVQYCTYNTYDVQYPASRHVCIFVNACIFHFHVSTILPTENRQNKSRINEVRLGVSYQVRGCRDDLIHCANKPDITRLVSSSIERVLHQDITSS
jgi:hypothetical protein